MIFVALLADFPVIETLIGIALILLVLDTFIATEFLSHLAMVTLCFAIYWWLDDWSLVWRLLASISSWFLMVGLYYTVFRGVGIAIANRVVAPTKYRNSIDSIVGKHGTIEDIDGKLMCRVGDSLFPIQGNLPMTGARVVITKMESGTITVKEV